MATPVIHCRMYMRHRHRFSCGPSIYGCRIDRSRKGARSAQSENQQDGDRCSLHASGNLPARLAGMAQKVCDARHRVLQLTAITGVRLDVAARRNAGLT